MLNRENIKGRIHLKKKINSYRCCAAFQQRFANVLTNGSPVHVSVGQETSLSKGVEVGFGFYGNWHETDVSDKW